jgi:hypothetical protein
MPTSRQPEAWLVAEAMKQRRADDEQLLRPAEMTRKAIRLVHERVGDVPAAKSHHGAELMWLDRDVLRHGGRDEARFERNFKIVAGVLFRPSGPSQGRPTGTT